MVYIAIFLDIILTGLKIDKKDKFMKISTKTPTKKCKIAKVKITIT